VRTVRCTAVCPRQFLLPGRPNPAGQPTQRSSRNSVGPESPARFSPAWPERDARINGTRVFRRVIVDRLVGRRRAFSTSSVWDLAASAIKQASFFTTKKQGDMEITEKPGSWRVAREHLIKHRAKCHSRLLRDLHASLLLRGKKLACLPGVERPRPSADFPFLYRSESGSKVFRFGS